MINQMPAMNLSPEATPWGRAMQERVVAGERELERLRASVENSLTLVNATIANIPIVTIASNSSTNFSLSSTFTAKASVNIPVPPGKTAARVVAVGGLAAADGTSGGVTTAYARIVIAGMPSVTFSAAKDAGASVVNNIITPSSGATLGVQGGAIPVSLEAFGENGAAFPAFTSNYAQLTVIATFS